MIYTIKVTQQDLDTGIKCEPEDCPVRRAIKRSTGRNCYVLTRTVFFDYNNTSYSFPDGIYERINQFDRGFKVEPFEFEMDFPFPKGYDP